MAITLRSPNGTSNGSQSNTHTPAITLPTGVQNGDVVIVVIGKGNQTAITPPAGYTIIGSQQNDSGSNSTAAYWHTWLTGDTTSPAFTWTTNTSVSWVVAAYVGVNTTTPIDANASQANASSNTATSPSITVPAGHTNDLLLLLYTMAGGGHSINATSEGTVRVSNTVNQSVFLADFQLTAAGATGNQTATFGGATTSIGFQVALQPAALPLPPTSSTRVRPFVQYVDWRALPIYAQAAFNSSPPVIPATVPFFSGFETADFSEWNGVIGTATIDSAISIGSAYSARLPWNGGTNTVFWSANPVLGTAYVRASIYTNAAGSAAEGYLLGFNSAGGTPIIYAHLVTDGLGGLKLRLWNHITGTQIGSDFPISASTWNTVELKLTVSAAAGVAEMRVNQTVVATGSSLNTGMALITTANLSTQTISGAGLTGNVWFDNVQVNTQQYPGFGYVIARQIALNGTYNQWAYSSGTLLSGVLNKTPVTGVGNVNTTTAGNRFSGVVDFTTANGIGSSGFGNGTVGSSDTINAFKIGVFGQTNSFASDGPDSTLFHTGGDTLKQLAGSWTTNAAPGTYQETYNTNIPSAAQVRNCEVGVQKGSGTNLHLIYDIWAQVDYVPLTTGPTTTQPLQTAPLDWRAVQTYAQLGSGAVTSSFPPAIQPGTPQPYSTQTQWNAIAAYAQAGKSGYTSAPLMAVPGQQSVQPFLTQQQWNATKIYAEAGRQSAESSTLFQYAGGTPAPYPTQTTWNAVAAYAQAGRAAYDSTARIVSKFTNIQYTFFPLPGVGGKRASTLPIQPPIVPVDWRAIRIYAEAGSSGFSSSPLIAVPGQQSVQPFQQQQKWNALQAYAEAGRTSAETSAGPPPPPLATDDQYIWMPQPPTGIIPPPPILSQPTTVFSAQSRTEWNALRAYAQAGASGFNSSPLVDVPGQHGIQPVQMQVRWDALRGYAQAGQSASQSSATVFIGGQNSVQPYPSTQQWNAVSIYAALGKSAFNSSPLVDVPGQHGVQPIPSLQPPDWRAVKIYAQAGQISSASSPLVDVPGQHHQPPQPPLQRIDWNALRIYGQAGRSAFDSSMSVDQGGDHGHPTVPPTQRVEWNALKVYAQAGRSAFDSSPLVAVGGQQSVRPYLTQQQWNALQTYAEAGRSGYDSSPFLGRLPTNPSQRQPVQYLAWNALRAYAEAGRGGVFGPPVVPPPPLKHLHFNGPWAVQNLTIWVIQVSAATSLL